MKKHYKLQGKVYTIVLIIALFYGANTLYSNPINYPGPQNQQWNTQDHSDEVTYAVNGLKNCDTEVLANTLNYGEKLIIVDSVAPDTFYLRDCTRGGGVETYNIFNSFSFEHDQPINLYDNIPGATDAQWSTEMVYDFYLERFGLNSFDGQGTKMVTLINFGPANMGGSFFSGIFAAIGSGTMPFVDLVGHEFSHGVLTYNSGAYGGYEAGALGESFCNIIGTAAEFWALPESASWLFASIDPSKYNMSNPNASISPVGTHYPDTYLGNYWEIDGNNHLNASVQDYCFYLLSEGGSGINDNDDEYSVEGIGIENAMDIFYRAVTVYLTGSIQFNDARQATIQSATDLYGECSNEVEQVINAWYAVGVGLDSYTQDLSLISIVSPVNNCDLSAEEIVEVEVLYNVSGCNDIIPAGSEIEMTYQWNENEPVVETLILDEDFVEGDILNYSFMETISLPNIAEEHELSVWIEYTPEEILINNSIMGYKVERKLDYNGSNMGFETPLSSYQYFYTNVGAGAKAVIDTVAKNTGEYGFLMSSTKSYPNPILEDSSLNFEYHEQQISEICFCVDAQDWEHVTLYFDMKQTLSGLYMFIYGSDSAEYYSSMRMMINGEQFGEQFHPVTYTDDPYLTYNYSLDQLAGTYFEFCFQSKNNVNDFIDDSNIFTYDTDGDNTYLDNILFVDEVFTDIAEIKANDLTIYPNPATIEVTIAFNLKEESIVKVNLYNQNGQKVKIEPDRNYSAGNHKIQIDTDLLSPGTYFYNVITSDQTLTGKLVIVK